MFSSCQSKIHKLHVATRRTLVFEDVAALAAVGIDERAFRHGDHGRSRAVGAAAYFLEMDGLIVPSARSACTNLVLLPDRTPAGVVLQVEESRELDWPAWRETVAAAKIASPPGS